MKKTNCILFFLCIFLIGCASYQEGKYASVISGNHPSGVPISAWVDQDLSTSHLTVIYFTFGNDNKDWVRLKKVRLTNTQAKQPLNVVVGDDLTTWVDSINHKLKVDQWNKNLFWGTMTLAGIGTSALSKNSNIKDIGRLTAIGSLGALSFDKFTNELNEIERGALIPRTHIYQPLSIPPGLFTTRWILLANNTKDITNVLDFEIEFESGEKASYLVQIY